MKSLKRFLCIVSSCLSCVNINALPMQTNSKFSEKTSKYSLEQSTRRLFMPVMVLAYAILKSQNSNEKVRSDLKSKETQTDLNNLEDKEIQTDLSNKKFEKNDSIFDFLFRLNDIRTRVGCIRFLNSHIMREAMSRVISDKTLVNLNLKSDEDVLFIGDLHCSVYALETMAKPLIDKLRAGKTYVVFTGDYADPKGFWRPYSPVSWKRVDEECVDKCDGSYGCLCFAAYLKFQFPDKVILLRGNHESSGDNNYGSFSWILGGENIIDMPVNDNNAVNALSRVFDFNSYLPLGVRVQTGNKSVVAFHGCLHKDMNKIEEGIRGNTSFINQDKFPIATNILWNEISWEDIIEHDHRGMGLELLRRSELEKIMKDQNIDYFVHGHNHTEEAYKPLSNGKGCFCAIAADFSDIGAEDRSRIIQFKNGVPKIIWRENWNNWDGESIEEYLS